MPSLDNQVKCKNTSKHVSAWWIQTSETTMRVIQSEYLVSHRHGSVEVPQCWIAVEGSQCRNGRQIKSITVKVPKCRLGFLSAGSQLSMTPGLTLLRT